MRPVKRKLKSRKAATRRSPQKAPKRTKAASRKSQSKPPRKIAAVRPLPAQPEEILFRVEGKMSTFGGPHDLGMAANEDVALFSKADLQNPKYTYLFLPASPRSEEHTSELQSQSNIVCRLLLEIDILILALLQRIFLMSS